MVSDWALATLVFSWARDAGKPSDRGRIAVTAISRTRLNVLRPLLAFYLDPKGLTSRRNFVAPGT